MAGGNRAQRRAAAKANGLHAGQQLFSQLVVVDDLGDEPHTAIAAALVAGLAGVVEAGGAPLERCAITLGTDHPEHPGKIVLEVKTDRVAPKRKPLSLGLLPSVGLPMLGEREP